jgi:exosortase
LTLKRFRPFDLTLFVGSILVAWHPLASTLKLASENDEYTHILLILPLSLAFICIEWKSLRPILESNVFNGSLILCLAAVVAGLVRSQAIRMAADLQLSIQMLTLVTAWIGSFVLCFGTKASRLMIFPLCFLYWMVPLPSFALNEIVKCLQQGSAVVARLLFAGAGVPVAQDGLMLSIPGLTVEVAKECSSIRSSLMLLVTTMVLAQLLLHSSWRKALVIALAVPLSIAKNGLRIFTIAMLGTRVDPGFLNGKLHRDGGIVFFAIALSVIFFLLWILRRTERDVTRAAVLHPPSPETLTMINADVHRSGMSCRG